MTEHNNSSNDDTRPQPQGSGDGDDWQAFLDEHAHELKDVERSRTARRFDRHAQRREKQALLSVHDLQDDAFVGEKPGPRDFRSSWLDVDDAMDRAGGGFSAPNPDLSGVGRSRLAFGAVLAVGVLGVIATVFFPSWAPVLGVVFALCILVGAGGLLMRRGGRDEASGDAFDDGARV